MTKRKGRRPRHDTNVVVPDASRQRFVLEYVRTWNCSYSAVAAGFTEATGHQMLKDPAIVAAIEAAVAARNEALRVDAHWVLQELLEHYAFSADKLVDAEGNFNLTGISKSDRRFIDSVEITSVGGKAITKIKLANKTKLLELIGKHVGVGAFRLPEDGNAGGVTINIEPEDEKV